MDFGDSCLIWTAKCVLGLGVVFAVNILFIIIYRLTFHPLAKFPGPLLAKITDFYAVYHAYIGDIHLDMWRCHQAFGNFVRYGPNKIIVNTSTAIPEIYGPKANVQKSTAYRAFETSSTALDLQSTVNKVAHARKRRVISQAFSDSAIRSFETHILQHVAKFISHLAPNPEEAGKLQRDFSWSTRRDMSKLCKIAHLHEAKSVELSSNH